MRLMAGICLLLVSFFSAAESLSVKVTADFVNLYSGPGRGYPITQVVLKGEQLELQQRRTDWVQVSFKQQQLWLARQDLSKVVSLDNEYFQISDDKRAELLEQRWQLGLMFGDFNGNSYYQLNTQYAFSHYVQTELAIGQAQGEQANNQILELSVLLSPFPQWRLSPYFAIGGGMIRINPRTILVQSTERNNALASTELGLRFYLTRQFILRGGYRHSVIMTDSDDNKETDTWKLGFSVFF
ncbi:SH3 domain-containing protein [Rheinheimera salexigens]|uniref:SH3b domain-containing protein n=2 Tax=Rheinheimera salexigens TaxID=1628148 RepID=A0A1E7Q8I3_9GAMM|nr:hypothetical protein BI198_13715 [Rheinheimera salexigens]